MFLFPDVLMCTFPKRKMLKIEHIIKLRDLGKVIVSQERGIKKPRKEKRNKEREEEERLITLDVGAQQSVLHLRWKEREVERDLNLYISAIEASEWSDAIQKAKTNLQIAKPH